MNPINPFTYNHETPDGYDDNDIWEDNADSGEEESRDHGSEVLDSGDDKSGDDFVPLVQSLEIDGSAAAERRRRQRRELFLQDQYATNHPFRGKLSSSLLWMGLAVIPLLLGYFFFSADKKEGTIVWEEGGNDDNVHSCNNNTDEFQMLLTELSTKHDGHPDLCKDSWVR